MLTELNFNNMDDECTLYNDNDSSSADNENNENYNDNGLMIHTFVVNQFYK